MRDFDEFFTGLKRCTACILPETLPGISFNEQGVCNYCRNHVPIQTLGENALQDTLSQYRNKGKTYDCIAPLSGGRDSTYVLHRMVRKYNMRVLALTVDSGAITPEGYRNIETATRILNVPHIWLSDQKQIATSQKNTRIKFQGWLKKPAIHTIIPVLNASDKTMNLRMYRYAAKHRIPLLLGGNNIGNSDFERGGHWKTGFLGVLPNHHGRYSSYDYVKLSYLYALEYLKNPYNYRFPILKEYAFGASVYFFESLLKPRNVESLGFYDYIYWNEKDILTTVCEELDWKGAEDTTATWRIDDAAYPLINYLFYKLVGFTEHDQMYSMMIREGQISRKEALERCVADHQPRLPSLTRIFEELGVTKEQVDQALEPYREELLEKR